MARRQNMRARNGVMDATMDTVGRALTGVEDIGREVGATAMDAVRGTLDAAERIASVTDRAVRHLLKADTRASSPSATSGSKRAVPRRSRRRSRRAA